MCKRVFTTLNAKYLSEPERTMAQVDSSLSQFRVGDDGVNFSAFAAIILIIGLIFYLRLRIVRCQLIIQNTPTTLITNIARFILNFYEVLSTCSLPKR